MQALSGSRTERGIAERMAAMGREWPPKPVKALPSPEPVRPVRINPEPVVHFESRGSANAKRRLRELCAEHGVGVADICGFRRSRWLAAARQKIASQLASEFTPEQMPLQKIGMLLGGRHHTTILHCIQKYGCPERGHPVPGDTDADG
jgi:Bacterial dnaA protein helix-turn-helix